MAGKFLRHRLAIAAGIVILLFYFVGAFVEFLAPGLPDTSRPQYTFAPPQTLSFFAPSPGGGTRFLPHVDGYAIANRQGRPAPHLRPRPVEDRSRLASLSRGPAYKLWGLIPLRPASARPRQPQPTLLPAGRRSAWPRRLLAPDLCNARVDVDRPGGRGNVARSRHRARRRFRLLRRMGRYAHPTPDRGSERDADDPALARPRRRHSAYLVATARLFRYYSHRFVARLDLPRARGARPCAGLAAGRFRGGGAPRRRQRGAADLPPHPALAHQPHPRSRYARGADR